MSSRERSHPAHSVSGDAIEPIRAKMVAPTFTSTVAVENCPHGVSLGKFCTPCAEQQSRRNRIDVV